MRRRRRSGGSGGSGCGCSIRRGGGTRRVGGTKHGWNEVGARALGTERMYVVFVGGARCSWRLGPSFHVLKHDGGWHAQGALQVGPRDDASSTEVCIVLFSAEHAACAAATHLARRSMRRGVLLDACRQPRALQCLLARPQPWYRSRHQRLGRPRRAPPPRPPPAATPFAADRRLGSGSAASAADAAFGTAAAAVGGAADPTLARHSCARPSPSGRESPTRGCPRRPRPRHGC